MTTVVHERTGEIIESLSEADARRLTMKIRLAAESVSERIEALVGYVEEAKAGRADIALGYASWTAYVEHEFADALPRLDRAQRQEVVAQLSATGMSTRSIAPIVRVHHDTVASDLRPPVGNPTPALKAAQNEGPGWEGPDDWQDVAEIVEAEIVEDGPAPLPKITGRDGKEYPRLAARPEPNRRALTDAFRDKTSDLLKIVRALTDLTIDDRFTRNKEQVAARNRNDLQRALDALSGVVAQLD